MTPRRAIWTGNRQGLYTIEWAMFILAVIVAATLMAPYVMSAIRANATSIQAQANAAVADNQL